MVFTPNLICRFFFVTCQCHYCYLYPPLVTSSSTSTAAFTPSLLLLLRQFLALSISLSPPHPFPPPSLMATQLRRSPSVPSLPPPSPKSPPDYPDLYGKRRETARVQMLEREISFLEEELKSVEALQPASRCCKEIADFVLANSDPLLPTNKKDRGSCRFWKWLSGMACWKLSWVWCWCCGECCCGNLKRRSCCCECKGGRSCWIPCMSCCCCLPKPKWPSCSCCNDSCCNTCWPCPKSNFCEQRHLCIPQSCCSFQCDSCPSCCTCKCSCSCSCPSCPKLRPCCSCTNSCWNPCCLCC